jgi:hypothetical protein
MNSSSLSKTMNLTIAVHSRNASASGIAILPASATAIGVRPSNSGYDIKDGDGPVSSPLGSPATGGSSIGGIKGGTPAGTSRRLSTISVVDADGNIIPEHTNLRIRLAQEECDRATLEDEVTRLNGIINEWRYA